MAAGVGPCDAVIGVAASGRTPYTLAAIAQASAAGALTIGIANNADAPLAGETSGGKLGSFSDDARLRGEDPG